MDVVFIEENVIMLGEERYHHSSHETQEIKNLLSLILKNLNKMANTQAQDAQILRDLKTQLARANDEIQAKIQALIDAAASAPVSDELQAAIDDLKPAAQALDDIVPEAPPVP